jgi:hypothetical protein
VAATDVATLVSPQKMQMLHNPDLIEMLLARVKVIAHAVNSYTDNFFRKLLFRFSTRKLR